MNPPKLASKRGRALDVEQALAHAIQSGQYRPDAAIPSVRELAKLHGCHYNTVQTVIKRLAAKGLVTSVKRRGVFVSPRLVNRNPTASMQKISGSDGAAGAAAGVVGGAVAGAVGAPLGTLLSPPVGALGIMCLESLTTDPFNNDDRPLVRYLERIAAETGRPVFRYDLNPATLANTAGLVERCLDDRVGGVIIVGVRDTEPLGPILQQLRERQVPVVVCPLGRQSIAANLHVPIVNSDDRLAGVVAAQHLYDLGHRELAMVTYDRPRPYIDQRMAGFKAVCQLHGLRCDPARLIQLPVAEMNEAEHQRVGFEAFAMLSPAITGVFGINDRVAAGLIDAAVAAGHQIGKTFSVVGHDNDLRYDDKQITTVIPPLLQIGRRACDLLQTAVMGAIDPHGEHIILRPQLLWRRSTGRLVAASV